MRVLVFNGGSSSLKASVFSVASASDEADPAKAEWETTLDVSPEAPQEAPAALLKALPSPNAIDAVGHRIVNGGKAFPDPVRITAEVKSALASLASSAPQHNALEMAAIKAAEEALGPRVPQSPSSIARFM